MITMRDFMETVNYRITETGDYGWKCYGEHAYSFDSWSGDNDDGYSVGIVFDTNTQVVYEMEAHDYANQRSYRYIEPAYRKKYEDEARAYNVDPDESYDTLKFIDLETPEDMLTKARAIVAGEDYDTRIEVPLDLDDDVLLSLALEAHKRDITINKMVEILLKQAIASKE